MNKGVTGHYTKKSNVQRYLKSLVIFRKVPKKVELKVPKKVGLEFYPQPINRLYTELSTYLST